MSPDDGEALITRQKEVYDGAIPWGNSKDMTALEGKTTAYVCSNFSCRRPARDIAETLRRLQEPLPGPVIGGK